VTNFEQTFFERLKRYDWHDTSILCENFRLFEPGYWPTIFEQLPDGSKRFWLNNCTNDERHKFVAVLVTFSERSIHLTQTAEKDLKFYRRTTIALLVIVSVNILLTAIQLGGSIL